MKICSASEAEAAAAKGVNSSCIHKGAAAGLAGLAAMTPEDMEVVVAKIISLLVLTILSVLAGLLPLRLLLHFPQLFTRHRATVDYFLRGLRCLSGGVFLATGFLHLLPDTRDKMAAVLINLGSRTHYAVTELLIMAGFFLVVFVEQVIKCLYLKAERSDELRAKRHASQSGRGDQGLGATTSEGASGDTGPCHNHQDHNQLHQNRYRSYSYSDKGVIPSTLEELGDDLPPTAHRHCSGDDSRGCEANDTCSLGDDDDLMEIGGGDGGGGCNVSTSHHNINNISSNGILRRDSCSVGYSGGYGHPSGGNGGSLGGNGGCDGGAGGSGVGGGGGGGGTVVTFSSSPDDHDTDSVVSDTFLKEEHNAFMDPCSSELDYPASLMQHSLDYELEQVPGAALRCNHAATTLGRNQSHSLPELGVTKVVKQLSQADLTRRAHFRSIIYIMALSLHGIFEGLALGLQSTENSVWSLCFALCLHRCVLAFQLGMDLCGARESQGTAFLCIGTFTLISALGIVAGILFSSGALLYADVTVPEAILQSLATGTILYIVFFDILFKDMQGVGDLKRVSSCFVGFALMAIILAITTR